MTPYEIVTGYAEALAQGDVLKAFSFFSADVLWHQPGDNQFSGLKPGAEDIGNMISAMMRVSNNTFSISPNGKMMLNDNLVAMPLLFSGQIEDRSIDMPGIDLFRVDAGKIAEVWLFSDDQMAEDTFWGL